MHPFYPLLRAPNCEGITILHNYAPNNWELRKISSMFFMVKQ